MEVELCCQDGKSRAGVDFQQDGYWYRDLIAGSRHCTGSSHTIPLNTRSLCRISHASQEQCLPESTRNKKRDVSLYLFALAWNLYVSSFLKQTNIRVNSIARDTTYFDIMQNISKISALLLAIFLSPILVGIRGEFLENFNEVKRPILFVIGGEITAKFEYYGHCLAGRQAYVEVRRFQQFAQSIERTGRDRTNLIASTIKCACDNVDDLRHVTVGSVTREQIVDIRGGHDRQKQSPGWDSCRV